MTAGSNRSLDIKLVGLFVDKTGIARISSDMVKGSAPSAFARLRALPTNAEEVIAWSHLA